MRMFAGLLIACAFLVVIGSMIQAQAGGGPPDIAALILNVILAIIDRVASALPSFLQPLFDALAEIFTNLFGQAV